MGGKAFDKPAEKLTNAQFDQLENHCHQALKPFFKNVLTNRHFRSKQVHGDIDLACALDGIDIDKPLRGQDRGYIVYGEDTESVINVIPGPAKDKVDWDKKDTFSALIQAIGRRLGAVEWARTGTEVHIIALRIPLDVISAGDHTVGFRELAMPTSGELDMRQLDIQPPAEVIPFCQVDLVLIPPPALDFCQFNFSFGQTLIILFAAIRLVSPSLTLHATHLGIVHPAYEGIPRIRIFLTHDHEEVCDWLGLEHKKWENGFEDELDYWMWFARPEKGKIVDRAWRLISQGIELPKDIAGQGTRRARVWNGFYEWLITSPESGWAIGTRQHDEAKPTVDNYRLHRPKPTSTSTTIDQDVPLPKPEQPFPLDCTALNALDRWGKGEEFDRLLDIAKEAAIDQWAKKERRRANRQAAKAYEVARLARIPAKNDATSGEV